MKKNKLYLVIALIISIVLFATAALCDQFLALGTQVADEDEEDVAEEESLEAVEEKTEEEAEEESLEEEAEEEADETEGEEESAEEEEPAGEEEEEEEIQTAFEEPTIELEVYEGPLYSSADDVCYWRVQAIVYGVPTPTVEFTRDDSNGAWGSKKAQINLTNPGDSFTLQATATNSEGSGTDSIVLTWECNRPPEISDIIMTEEYFLETNYTISVSAADPDGDTLTYAWSVSGGGLSSATGETVEWTTPSTTGTYQVTVEADDGNGGTDIRTKSVEVKELVARELLIETDEGGEISKLGTVFHKGIYHRVGDISENEGIKGFVSFDLRNMEGATIRSARLTCSSYASNGDASDFRPLWVASAFWGPRPLFSTDYRLSSEPIDNFNAANFMTSNPKLKIQIQNAINMDRDRFQIILYFTSMETDNDGMADYWKYQDSDISLFIEYTP
jgi:hypothetical protein